MSLPWPIPMASGSIAMSLHLLVSSGVTSLIIEYQPAPFGKPEAKVLEWVLLAFVALAGRLGAADRALPAGSCPRVAAPGADVDPQRPVFCPGVGAGLATLLDGLPLAMRSRGNAMTARRSGRRRRLSACSC